MRKTTQQSIGNAARFSAKLYFLKAPRGGRGGDAAAEQAASTGQASAGQSYHYTAVETLSEPESVDFLALYRSPEGNGTYKTKSDNEYGHQDSPSSLQDHLDVKGDDAIPGFLMKIRDIEVEQQQASQMSAFLGGASASFVAGRVTAGKAKRLTRTIYSRNHDVVSCGAGVLIGILMLGFDLSIQTSNASEQLAVAVSQDQPMPPLQTRLVHRATPSHDQQHSLMAVSQEGSADPSLGPPPAIKEKHEVISNAAVMQDVALKASPASNAEKSGTVVRDTHVNRTYVTLNPATSDAIASPPAVTAPPAAIQAIDATQISALDTLKDGPAVAMEAPADATPVSELVTSQLAERNLASRQKAVVKSEFNRTLRHSASGRSKVAATQPARPSARVKRQAQPYKVGAPGVGAKAKIDRISRAKADSTVENPPFVAALTLDEAMSR